MFFITDEPKLFNVETGIIIEARSHDDAHWVDMSMDEIFSGTRQECEDFIFALAGWVGAVNPIKAGADNG